MCGRYTLTRIADMNLTFPWIKAPQDSRERYNIAPSQPILIARNTPSPAFDYALWGLIPSWAKDASIGNKMINARAETLAEKPSFKTALKRRRCIIPADGFYEWQKNPDGKSKTPMYIRLKSHAPLAFAGLWETWRNPDGSEIDSCTIITTRPNDLMKPIHDRMPAILTPESVQHWLDPREQPPESLTPLLQPYAAHEMEAHPVSRQVNNPKSDTPSCIDPAPPDGLAPGGLSPEGLFS